MSQQPWVQIFADWAHEVTEGPLDLKGHEIPERLRHLLTEAVEENILVEAIPQRGLGGVPPLATMVPLLMARPVAAGYLYCDGALIDEEVLPKAFCDILRKDWGRPDGFIQIPDLRVRVDGEIVSDPDVGHFIWTGDDTLVPFPDGYSNRCMYFSCDKRNPGTGGPWWLTYGTCSREHAVDHYGPEGVDE